VDPHTNELLHKYIRVLLYVYVYDMYM